MMFSSVLLSAALTQPPLITAADFHSGRFDAKIVCLEATIADAFVDEIDPSYVFFVLNNGGDHLYSYIRSHNLPLPAEQLVGAEITARGAVVSRQRVLRNPRRHAQRFLDIAKREDLVITEPVPTPFNTPDIDTAINCRPSELVALGRCSARGTVLAVWNAGKSCLLARTNSLVRVDLANAIPPAVGAHIIAAGLPETDLAHINLSRAIWKLSDNERARPVNKPQNISITDLLTNRNGAHAFALHFYGQAVRLSGTARNTPDDAHAKRLVLSKGTDSVIVDVSACPGTIPEINPGDTIEVTGIALYDIENCRPSAAFPQIRNYLIVPATTGDLTILARAPSPLPTTAWYILSTLLSIVFAIGLWCWSLRRIARKRGKALADEEIARAEADLRTFERTRLAVELHDSLAQNLTGVALEIETAQRMNQVNVAQMKLHLDRAEQTLNSCRNELRNCLWDLRSEALEEEDMNEAIRRTLLPSVKDIHLIVRFNVARSRLSDTTAHSLLRIIRELTVNGIRHGGATQVQIAGTIDNGHLLVSVRDNGCGFDAATAPGVADGHFGLEGIRERLEQLSGDFTIESTPGQGTRATLVLPVPLQENT